MGVGNRKIIFLLLNQNISCEYPKEAFYEMVLLKWNKSWTTQRKDKITILCSKDFFISQWFKRLSAENWMWHAEQESYMFAHHPYPTHPLPLCMIQIYIKLYVNLMGWVTLDCHLVHILLKAKTNVTSVYIIQHCIQVVRIFEWFLVYLICFKMDRAFPGYALLEALNVPYYTEQ